MSPKTSIQTKNVNDILKILYLSVPQTKSEHFPRCFKNFNSKPCSLSCMMTKATPGGRSEDYSPGLIWGFTLKSSRGRNCISFCTTLSV